ncbi:30S ribosomal protein S7 [Lujinxingia litoralis]|uniref:Small ribosomal subunit protein uS7 n=1 Tax=Lujinxingia litoralis TaxID=2211119 RepID=A0A328C8V2_9DELT|nr:30S ribosomal protein S7 [Lujinxingia litoralis]RAL25047.1 30S ribosomal protein S7 [Lujinxingia litoralis]
MPRRRVVQKRPILPDPKFNDKLITQFVNVMMRDGKKSTAEQIMYDTLDVIESKTGGEDPLRVFKRSIDNLRPMVEVRSRRVGGSTYQVPVEVRPERRTALAIRWLIQAARARNEKTMVDKLTNEILDASNNRGTAVRNKENVHRMAEANRAFAHYRW